tara:strand:+ start:6267 stop:8471 length:2205 start_codon:yes stop_codon:yes gene_type:complete
MLLVQQCFRENFSLSGQKAFRQDQINHNLKQLTSIKTDGTEIECGILNSSKTSVVRKKVCEGYQSMEKNKYALLAEKCNIVNGIEDWRVRANRIPENDILDGTKGCGFCYDTKNVYYGDEKGPFKNVGPVVCGNWIAPGKKGSHHTKNIFGDYPFEDDFYKNPSDKNLQFGQGVVKDTVKMYEQDLCKQMKNCGDQNLMGEDGTALCGWCNTGRRGDGTSVGMVRKGGNGDDQNETKYDDDFCHWPREIDGGGKKTFLYKKKTKELKSWKENNDILITVGDLSGQTITVDKPGRLLNGLKHCAASAALFPCFPNFTGKIPNKDGELKHSKKCYDEIWRDYALYTDNNGITTTCDGDVKERIKNNLPNSNTFTIWDKTFIPSVEGAVGLIPQRMSISKQHDCNYPSKSGTKPKRESKGWFLQWMTSAFINSKTCTDKAPDPCLDKYRSREYNFFRPKECINGIVEKFSTANFEKEEFKYLKEFLKVDDGYTPGVVETYVKYWPIYNDDVWKEGIHFDWSNEEYLDKLKAKWGEFQKVFTDCRNGGNVGGAYDKGILAIKYLVGDVEINKDVIEGTGSKFWEDNDGGTDGSWVKLCWEDFRLELKRKWGDKDRGFLNKKGEINITEYKPIIQLIKGEISSLNRNGNSRKFHDILTYEDNGMKVPVELTEMGGQTIITKQNYEHKYFPFWRVLDTDFYIKNKWMVKQEKRNKQRKDRMKARDIKRKILKSKLKSKGL